jgi:hypothetical protein
MTARWTGWALLGWLAGMLGVLAALGAAPGEAPAGKKYALLVGVCEYSDTRSFPQLRYCIRDMDDLGALLRRHGYEVTVLRSSDEDPGRRATIFNIQARLAEVLTRCQRDDLVLVGLGGHGVQFRGREAYFCPQDAYPQKNKSSLLSLSDLYRQMELSKAGVKLLLVDACRNDPTAKGAGALRGVDGNTMPRPPRGWRRCIPARRARPPGKAA